MNEQNPEFGRYLSDFRWDRLRLVCVPCGREGSYRPATLRTMLGNPPMEDVPRLLAIKAGCAMATRHPGTSCSATLVSPNAPKVENLAVAYHAGWRLVLSCGRSRQGLKSVKACRQPFHLDLESLVAALGHDVPLEGLQRRLVCPGCGSTHNSLTWAAPKPPPATEPIPFKRAG